MTNLVQWVEEFDDFDNSIWEAPSPFHDDGVHFHWRIKQRLSGNRIEWYASHDSELGGDCNGITWPTIEAAKAAVQEAHDDIIRTECGSQSLCCESCGATVPARDLDEVGFCNHCAIHADH